MASLTLRRWIALVAAACVAMLALFPARPVASPMGRWMGSPDSASYYKAALRQNTLRLRVVRIADSLSRTSISATISRDTVIIDRRIDPRIAADLHAAHARALATLGTRRAPLIMANIVYRPDAPASNAPPLVNYVLGDESHAPCVVQRVTFASTPDMIAAESNSRWHRNFLQGRDGFGICGLVSRHGRPSASMRRFLAAGGFQWAELGVAAPRTSLRPGWETRSWRSWRFHLMYSPASPASRLGAAEFAGCAAGDAHACAAAVSRHDSLAREIADSTLLFYRANNFGVSALGAPAVASIIASMAADLGPDQFARLWTDPRPTTLAFEAITGQPLATWLQGHLSHAVGPVPRGPAVSMASVGNTVILLLLVATLGGLAARSWRAGA